MTYLENVAEQNMGELMNGRDTCQDFFIALPLFNPTLGIGLETSLIVCFSKSLGPETGELIVSITLDMIGAKPGLQD